MSRRERILLSWSSGKDSAWALHTLRQRADIEVVALLTTINRRAERVAMHAVREELLEAQARAAGLPLYKVYIPSPCSNEQYEAAMSAAMDRARRQGIRGIAFGDLFLEDVRRYREDKLAQCSMEPLFPLWGLDTHHLAHQMIAAGLRAHITCVDPTQLDSSMAGRTYDAELIAELPAGVDPCGERGEFHTFAYRGPMFAKPISIEAGEIVERDGFVFGDLKLSASG